MKPFVSSGKRISDQVELSTLTETHLNALQSVIQRMAGNSAACKTWCIGLVTGVLSFSVNRKMPGYIVYVPIVMLMLMDMYYLYLERHFRELYNTFVRKVFSDEIEPDDFTINKPGETGLKFVLRQYAACFLSLSILPFYAVLAVMAGLASLIW